MKLENRSDRSEGELDETEEGEETSAARNMEDVQVGNSVERDG